MVAPINSLALIIATDFVCLEFFMLVSHLLIYVKINFKKKLQ